MEKPDPYGEWVIRKILEENAANPRAFPQEVVTAAKAVWPRLAAHTARELEREGSDRESVALAAEIWERVLRSVSRALRRKADYGSSITDFEAYLMRAFHHRFYRLRRRVYERRGRFQAAGSIDGDLVDTALDTEWASELERAITVREIAGQMDAWTRKVWQSRQYGYSWKEIAGWLDISEQQAKKKFEYGLEKTRQKILRLLKARRPR